MSLPPIDLLLTALQQPQRLLDLRPAQWDVLIRQARAADLLARIAAGAQVAGCWDAMAEQPRMHLASALQLAARQRTELRHEVREIERALQAAAVPAVLLKGAAYAMAGLTAAQGRMVSDVDILVPRDRLAQVESALMMAGWVTTLRDPYDQHYYRRWMHELPPLRHLRRGTVLDVHHALLPLTARHRPDSTLLLQASQALAGNENLRVLSAPDMVLHSAAHLFHEGELELGLRGLVDLEALLQEFSAQAGFWPELLRRAHALELQWPLFLALHYTAVLLRSTWAQEPLLQLRQSLRGRLSDGRLRRLDMLYLRALRPHHALAADRWTPLARWLLYLRAHALRMPPALLAPHLLRKLLSRLKVGKDTP